MSKILKRVFALSICIILLVSEIFNINVAGAAQTGMETGYGCQVGKYVYYAFEMGGVRMGIRRYNTKTKKSKEIFSYKINGEESNGFYDISVKGNYIYTVWDQYYGTGSSRTYIYRIKKDGSGSKRLACGIKPVVIGKRIYYEKCKEVQVDYGDFYDKETVWTGKMYSMKLDGSDKKKASPVKIKKLTGDWVENKKTDIINGYRYFIKGKNLYREKADTGKVKRLMSSSDGITNFYVCNQYILVKARYGKGDKMAAYIIKTNGKDKKRLASWWAAE